MGRIPEIWAIVDHYHWSQNWIDEHPNSSTTAVWSFVGCEQPGVEGIDVIVFDCVLCFIDICICR